MFESIRNKLYSWGEEKYFEPTFFCSTSLIDDLICFLNGEVNRKDFIISDGLDDTQLSNLLIVSGFINHKNIDLLKLKYSHLKGKKYVLTAGMMVNNQLNFPIYNQALLDEDFIFINNHIEGPNPTKADIIDAILTLEEN